MGTKKIVAKKQAKVKTKATKTNWKPAPKAPKPKEPVDELAAIRVQYDKATKQLAEVDAALDKEGLVLTVNVYSRSGKKVGQKKQRHPLAAIQRALRSDVVRLARVLQMHKPAEEPEKPGNAHDQKTALEKLHARAWELFGQQGDLLAERDEVWKMLGRNPWDDGHPEEWTALETEYLAVEAQIAAHRKGLSNNVDYE